MFWSKPLFSFIPTLLLSLLLLIITGGLVSCRDRVSSTETVILETNYQPVITAKLAEVAPPKVIQELNKTLDQYQPQVRIVTPQPNQLLSDTTVQISLEVQDYPLFQDETLEMGPHLNLILDNEPYQAIYDVSKPITLENLSPGTHTLRVFAARPWHESFKNDGAYAQTTFHVFTQTNDNTPDPNLPLLTYSQPKGNYGAEPILLDFYLTNAPLHIYAPGESPDISSGWRIRVTINGESFLLDHWQPIYLKGFEKGGNWVKLEFIDSQGNPVKNVFNDTARLITYTPGGNDTLSQLVRGDLSAERVYPIVNTNAPLVTTPPIVPSSELESTETIEKNEAIEESDQITVENAQETQEIEVFEPIETEIQESVQEAPLKPTDVNSKEELINPLPSPVDKIPEIQPETSISTPEELKIEIKPQEIPVPQPTPQDSPLKALEPSNLTKIEVSEPSLPLLTPEVSHKNISDLNATDLQLKLLESIEKLEQKLDNLPKTSIKIEVPDTSVSTEKNLIPEVTMTDKSTSNNIEVLRDDLKNRLQKWKELLKVSQ